MNTLRSLLIALAASAFLFTSAYTQMDTSFDSFMKDDDEANSTPLRTKLGGAGGFIPVYLTTDMKELNRFLAIGQDGVLPTNGLLLYGGEGYGYVMFLKNLRVGGMGVSGMMTTSRIQSTTSGNIYRETTVDISMGGFKMGYVLPVVKKLDIACDVMLGGGDMNITINRSRGTEWVWDTLFTHYGDENFSGDEYTQRINGSFWTYNASLNVEYALLHWLGLRVGVGYTGMVGGEWKLDDKFKIYNVPSKINGSGMTINAGIFAGFFGE
ncbi:MAG: hypothetical protein AAB071_02815 [Bacteroidota bacterium]